MLRIITQSQLLSEAKRRSEDRAAEYCTRRERLVVLLWHVSNPSRVSFTFLTGLHSYNFAAARPAPAAFARNAARSYSVVQISAVSRRACSRAGRGGNEKQKRRTGAERN